MSEETKKQPEAEQQQAAAETAVAAVREFLQTKTSIQRVIFNVFTSTDREIYADLLGH